MTGTKAGSRRRAFSCTVALLLALPVLNGCEQEALFRVVEVRFEEGDGGVFSLDLWGVIFGPTQEDGATQIPLRPGDELAVDFENDGFWIPILPTDGDTLTFRVENEAVYLDDLPVCLVLDDSDSWAWLEGATAEEQASLRILAIEDSVPPPHLTLLEELATHNRTIQLATDGGDKLIRTMLDLFDPEVFSHFDEPISAALASALSGESRLRKLSFSGDDVSDMGFLRTLPILEEVSIDSFDPEKTGPLPDSLPNLRSIYLTDPDSMGLASLGIQPNLEELFILNCSGSDPVDITGISRFPDLTFLAIRDCDVNDLSGIDQLKKLRWLALPWGTTQDEMEHVVITHPDLSVLELFASEDVSDLTPLTGLKKLDGLILGSSAPPDPLFEMDHLEYLGVSPEDGDYGGFDDEVFPRLKTELPGTVIGVAAPFCLGSGFILLLIPMVGLVWFLVGYRRKSKNTAPHHG